MSYVNACHELDELGGGHNRSTIHVKPVAYRNNGSLTAIVSDWLDSGIPGRPQIVTAAPFIVSCGDGGTRRIHPNRDLERYIEIGRPYNVVTRQPYPLNAFTRAGNHLISENSGADLHLWHGGHFLKFGLELKGGWLPANGQFAFPVDMVGLTRSGGNILADGVPVMHIRPPVAYDWANQEDVRPIAWDFASLAGQVYAVFTLPSLAGMARPVIDPTLDLQPDAAAGVDTRVDIAAVTTNYGTSTHLAMRAATYDRRSILKFDLSSIDNGSTCDTSTLYLYVYEVTSTGTRTQSIYPITAANDGWTEGGATYNTKDGSNNWAGGNTGCGSADTDYVNVSMGSFDLTLNDPLGTEKSASLTASVVEDWFGASNTNYGIVITSSYAYQDQRVCSSDHATAAYRPRLVVVYTLAGGGKPWYAYAQQ